MSVVCATRCLKNARFLQEVVDLLPKEEPLGGYSSIIPLSVLGSLHRGDRERAQVLGRSLSGIRLPEPRSVAKEPLFSGSLKFVRATFSNSGRDYSVPQADFGTAMKYAGLCIGPVSGYCSQYGPNTLSVAGQAIPFGVSLSGGKYNDQILSGWVDSLAKDNGLSQDSCLVFLNPGGVVNTDADATQGVLGYHSVSHSGVPYAFVNVVGTGLNARDEQGYFALALSHEIAEMTVDPRADGVNPEVCDSCAGNCGVDFRNYFDGEGSWMGGSPSPGYAFFIDGIAAPGGVSSCPAPEQSCSYPPPRASRRA